MTARLPNLVTVRCPYCENEFGVLAERFSNWAPIVLECDMEDTPGCGKMFVADVSVEVSVATQMIVPAGVKVPRQFSDTMAQARSFVTSNSTQKIEQPAGGPNREQVEAAMAAAASLLLSDAASLQGNSSLADSLYDEAIANSRKIVALYKPTCPSCGSTDVGTGESDEELDYLGYDCQDCGSFFHEGE